MRARHAVSIFTLWLCWTSTLFAQRGAQNAQQKPNYVRPGSGMPGFFDTALADKDSLVVEWPPLILPLLPIPSLAVDYGINDTLTVGTNALATGVPWLAGGYGVSFKARTLIYGAPETQSVATVYGGYLGSNRGDPFSSSWQMATSTTSWLLGGKHLLTAQALYVSFSLTLNREKDLNYTDIRLTSWAVGGSYEYIVSPRFAFFANALVPAVTTVEADTVATALSANLDATSGQLVWAAMRAGIDYREGNWLFSFGGIYPFGVVYTTLPWFSATKRW